MTRRTRPAIIRHRINRVADLAGVDPAHGAECDLRRGPRPGTVRLAHDPDEDGDDLGAWLDRFTARGRRGPLVLNVKEDGLEEWALGLVRQRGIEDFFFLDSQVPTLVRWTARRGERRFAVRLSRFEPPEAAGRFRGLAQWLWVDCFDGEPLPVEDARAASAGFRVCLVSPELQGAPREAIPRFADLLPLAEAVCTRHPDDWGCLLERSQ